MISLPPVAPTAIPTFAGILEHHESGYTILSPAGGRPLRRILYVNSYGGADIWDKIKRGRMPTNHLWGCLQLVHRGYEVALAEPLSDFYLYRRPVPHDLRHLRFARSWLGRDGIIYCGHNVLYWLPLLRRLRALHSPVVSLMFAREPLAWSGSHAGIIALTRAAADHARQLAPRVPLGHLGWGCDLEFFTPAGSSGDWFLSCGTTNRDHGTLRAAAAMTRQPIRVICGAASAAQRWPENVDIVLSNWPQPGAKALDPRNLADEHYCRALAGVIVLKSDPVEYTACGFTELLELMAMGRPIILTRTGALPGEIDLERHGCGLLVAPEDPGALAAAVDAIAQDPGRAAQMGRNSRALCERHYNIERFGAGLDEFFQQL